MRLSQVGNILCTICSARLFFRGCPTQFDGECCMSSPKNLLWTVGLLWHFLPVRKSPRTDLLVSSLSFLALGTLIIYIARLFSEKRLISFLYLLFTLS